MPSNCYLTTIDGESNVIQTINHALHFLFPLRQLLCATVLFFHLAIEGDFFSCILIHCVATRPVQMVDSDDEHTIGSYIHAKHRMILPTLHHRMGEHHHRHFLKVAVQGGVLGNTHGEVEHGVEEESGGFWVVLFHSFHAFLDGANAAWAFEIAVG